MAVSDPGQALVQLDAQAEQDIAGADSVAALEGVRVRYLGKKGLITAQLKRVGSLPVHDRRDFGRGVNRSKARIVQGLEQRRATLEAEASSQKMAAESLDVTQPGRRSSPGTVHPVTRTFKRMEEIFDRVGFDVASGPEIEDDYHNFEALNIPADHPARAMHDTFYIDGHTVLRTHTSPVQIRYMDDHAPPIRVIAPGKVYRCDSDVTHTPMFHQLEGLAIDREVTFADLKGILIHFIHEFFEKELAVRFRPSYFPFTEPSAEVDMGCVFCNGQGCRICKHTGWLEVLGCGMVHPVVLRNGGIDSGQYSGYAFGMGVERMTMLRYGINDLRLFFGNELRFLRQF
ncbi:MAG: phenylalanine--tRNA ligase subunit alpha [Gammaproteobacteria bacterium]|nr:phenylalanine--tRNA ligase subunit alpha [Gammaproteobacteria bacterium]